MRKISGAMLACCVCIMLAACAPQGRIEWTQIWGNTPLPQAAATCQYQANAASPALCRGIYGCLAEQNRTESLFSQCMYAAGWTARFIPSAAPLTREASHIKMIRCALSDGSSINTTDSGCREKGGTQVDDKK